MFIIYLFNPTVYEFPQTRILEPSQGPKVPSLPANYGQLIYYEHITCVHSSNFLIKQILFVLSQKSKITKASVTDRHLHNSCMNQRCFLTAQLHTDSCSHEIILFHCFRLNRWEHISRSLYFLEHSKPLSSLNLRIQTNAQEWFTHLYKWTKAVLGCVHNLSAGVN